MKKSILTLITVLLAGVSTAWGQVATVGSTDYPTFAEALAAANSTSGSTLTLLTDVSVDAQQVVTGTFTLDLNGKTISYVGNSYLTTGIIGVKRGATLTVKDSGTNGKISGGTNAYAAIAVTIPAEAGQANTPAANLIVESGTLQGYEAGITGNGLRHETNITINGGTITGTSTAGSGSQGIYHPQEGTLTINGGTIQGYSSAVEMRAGTLNINDGNFTATCTTYATAPNANGSTAQGTAIAIAQHTTMKDIDVNISGGTFNGTKAFSVTNPQNNTTGTIDIDITGGTFLGGIDNTDTRVDGFISGGTFSSAVQTEYLANDILFGQDSNGEYVAVNEADAAAEIGTTKYATLQAAIAAATAGQTITLLKDIDVTGAATTELKNADGSDITNVNIIIPQGKDITLDLNGNVIRGSNDNNNVLMNAGKLTITSTNGDGNIMAPSGCGVRAYSGSTTIIEDNVLIAAQECCVMTGKSTGATITINGGGFESLDNAVLSGNGTAGCGNNTWTVNGGEFTGYIKYTGYGACGIYAPNNDTWTINGGEFSIYGKEKDGVVTPPGDRSATGIVQRAGTVNIPSTSTVTFDVEGSTTAENWVGDSKVVVPTAALVFDSKANYPSNDPTAIMKVWGGTFNSNNISVKSVRQNTTDDPQIDIYGGTFNKAIEGEYCAPYLVPKDNGNGTYGVGGGKPLTDPSIIATIAPAIGNGESQTPIITIKDGETTLVEGSDYTVTLSQTGYTEPMTYIDAITITGIGSYTGTLKTDFTILAGEIKDIATATVTSTAVFTGAALDPKEFIEVKIGDTTVDAANYDVTVAGTDYVTAGTYKNAGTYTDAITITSKGSAYFNSLTTDFVIAPREMNEVTATVKKGLTWTGSEITGLNINGTPEAEQNVSLILTTGADASAVTYTLQATDYTWTSEPTPILEHGKYTITFEGKENFTGTKTVEIWVKKNIDHATVKLESENVVLPYGNNGDGKLTTNNLTVKDGDNVLSPNDDYEAAIYNTAAADGTALTEIGEQKDGVYYLKLTGKNAYDGSKIMPFYVLNEYYRWANPNDANTNKTYSIHLTSPSEANVGYYDNAEVIVDQINSLTIKATETIHLTNRDENPTPTVVTKDIDIAITGIDDNAFNSDDSKKFNYIDATALTDYTPSTLSRNAVGPFNGVPKQTLVYLNGNTITGENYVYLKNGTEYVCDVFKIYDDVNGNQQGFTETDGYKWAYENKYPFTANTIENTRQLKAGQHYTVCLPYRLPIPSTLKAYTLDASSSTLVGFKEVILEVSPFTPYVVIASGTGNLLSISTGGQVPATTFASDDAATRLTPAGTTNYVLVGTMRYMDGNAAKDNYIMQADKTWKKIEGTTSSYNGPCILPMRAYIAPMVAIPGGGARLTATFTNADGSTTAIRDLQLDNDGDDTYDLQGRKVDNSRAAKGVYIKNGKKLYK